jgi:hypothetical protein
MGWGTRGVAGRRAPRLLRALAAHPTLSAALLLALVVLAYLWPVLVGGKVLAADSVLYNLVPWQRTRPPDLAQFENYVLADVALVIHPWRELARELIRHGTVPLWNPAGLTGLPLLSNPAVGVFTPFSLPLWILPLPYAFGVSAALMLLAAALGTYLLARELGLGFAAALAAGVAFAFCSMNVMWLTWEDVTAVVAMLPWMLWLVERLLAGGGLGSACGLALVTAVAMGGGHPGEQVHVLVASGLYALLRVALAHGLPREERLRGLGLALGGMLVGIALMGVTMIPEILSSHDTIGTQARKRGAGTLPGLAHMPLRTIITPLLPDWWGRPSALETPDQPLRGLNVSYQERTFYAGAVALVLAAVGLTNRASLRRQAPFVVLGALGLAIALHAPGLWWLVVHLPALELVENQRLHFVFELAVAVLAGFGLQAVVERPYERHRQLAVAAAFAGVALIAAALATGSVADVGRVAEHFLTGRDFARESVINLTAAAWLLLLALGVIAALLALRRWPRRRGAIAAGLVLLVALDMLHFAHGYNPMAPAAKAIPPRTPAIAYLQRHRDEGRFVGVELALGPEVAARYGLADVRGYDPPYPTTRFAALWHMAAPAQQDWAPLQIDSFTAAAVQVTGALGARFVISGPGDEAPGGPDPALASLRRVYAGRDATIFVNPRATPRAFVASAIDAVPDAAAARAALVDSRFDARRAIVVERDQPGAAQLAGAQGARGTAAIAGERNAGVTLHATLDRRGVVVLGDQLLDGWSVRVDGRPATPLRVDAVLRGVVVGPGRHEIVWSYALPGLRAGIALSALGLALLLGGVLLARVRRVRAARARA